MKNHGDIIEITLPFTISVETKVTIFFKHKDNTQYDVMFD